MACHSRGPAVGSVRPLVARVGEPGGALGCFMTGIAAVRFSVLSITWRATGAIIRCPGEMAAFRGWIFAFVCKTLGTGCGRYTGGATGVLGSGHAPAIFGRAKVEGGLRRRLIRDLL